MKKTILMALAALPLAAFAQGMGPGMGPGMGMGRGMGPGGPCPTDGQGMGPGMPGMMGKGHGDPARMEKRMRLVRTLGLAEALDLDAGQALKLGETIAKFDERRLASHKTMHEVHLTLRRAAQGEKVTAAEVDQAIQKGLDARAQLQTIDRELVTAVTKDLSPEKKARAVLFLAKFQGRFGAMGGMGPRMMMMKKHMMGPGMGGPGMGGPGMGGPGGPGMGPGAQGQGPTGMAAPDEMEMELFAGPCMGPECELDLD